MEGEAGACHMCLAIPGRIVELASGGLTSAVVDVCGVRRRVELGLLEDDPPRPGDWVLIHVGFAMSKNQRGRRDRPDAHARDARRVGGSARGGARLRPGRRDGRGRRPPQPAAGIMRFVDEFREPELIRKAADEIRRLADPRRHYRLMEVCGGHTHAIYRFGLKDVLLPENIELIHGPGCPVCVLPMGRIDDGLAIAASDPHVIFAAFGDMMRVPGTTGSPLRQPHGRCCAQ